MYDFIIVGGGTAGCVLANRLSEDRNNRVLMLEAGTSRRAKELAIPAAWPKLFKSRWDWAYQSQPNPGMDGRSLFVPRGKTLGGSSSINAMMYLRGNAADYDEWAALGNKGWRYADVLPYFKRSEGNSRGGSEYHGASGPWAVTDPRDPNPLSLAFVAAGVEAGIQPNPDFNGSEQRGIGLVQVNQRNGRRCSAAGAFLRPVLRRSNLTVLTDAQATRVILEGPRAVGVSYLRDGREEVASGGEVVLCGGAINTPQLLLLSGIGPELEITRHGIELRHKLEGVGANLQDHPSGKILGRCPQPLTLFAAESAGNLARYLLFGRGMLSSNGAEAVAFVQTRLAGEAPDVEIIFLPVLWIKEGLASPPGHGFTVASMLLKPKSRGFVALASKDPTASPVIHPNHFGDEEGIDLKTVVEGMKIARDIVNSPAFAAFNEGMILPNSTATDSDWEACVRAEGQSIYHPVGTCKMGVDAAAVVDHNLRIHGLERLSVIDASVFPTIPRGHTAAPTVMLAEKAADLLL